MRIVEKRARVWGNQYGRTHRGWRLYLFGVPIWRRKRRVDRAQGKEQNGSEGNLPVASCSAGILQDC